MREAESLAVVWREPRLCKRPSPSSSFRALLRSGSSRYPGTTPSSLSSSPLPPAGLRDVRASRSSLSTLTDTVASAFRDQLAHPGRPSRAGFSMNASVFLRPQYAHPRPDRSPPHPSNNSARASPNCTSSFPFFTSRAAGALDNTLVEFNNGRSAPAVHIASSFAPEDAQSCLPHRGHAARVLRT